MLKWINNNIDKRIKEEEEAEEAFINHFVAEFNSLTKIRNLNINNYIKTNMKLFGLFSSQKERLVREKTKWTELPLYLFLAFLFFTAGREAPSCYVLSAMFMLFTLFDFVRILSARKRYKKLIEEVKNDSWRTG